ncbi:MAG: hypothetical protein ACPGPE_05245 [Planctomycetota bacterium]
MTDSGCTATIGTPNYDDGAPGTPRVIATAFCDACDTAQAQVAIYTYSKTDGFSYCLTLSEEVGIALPAGPHWSLSHEHEFCWDNEETSSVSAELHCAKGTKTTVTIIETPTPGTIRLPIDYSKWADFKKQDPFHPACFDPGQNTRREEIACGSETREAGYEKYTYTFDFDDLTCPSPPGTCERTSKSVYSTEHTSSTEHEHRVDELIPCYYPF